MEKWRLIRDSFDKNGLKKTLLEVMLWNLPGSQSVSINVAGAVLKVEVLAELPGAAFLQVATTSPDATSWFKQVDRELAKRFPERLIRFQHHDEDSWLWPKKLASGSLSYERLTTSHNQLPDFLAQRLAGLSFTPKDHQTLGLINPVLVKEKIRGQFESAKVTSDFFKKFKEKHELLSAEIKGIESPEEASSYSTLMLNRLMFIYFLQKKEFLNGDPNYLRTCLQKVQALKGSDKFYSFYKDYLLELFFNKLDNPEGLIPDPVIQEIAGDIPYVNGGVFSKSHAESIYEIEIPDSAFEEIFRFFDSYTWHLDTRPTGTSNEINPEVIGYIFEQYINYTADGKKKHGAYYTKHDVTGYMVSQTLVPRILDEVIELGANPFPLLALAPDSYIYESSKHGWDSELGVWKPINKELVDCWDGDPIGWALLDSSETDPKFCLPDESWVEMFARREQAEKTRYSLSSGSAELNDALALNINLQQLLEDSFDLVKNSETLERLWGKLSGLSVLDPTCGSGAFLFAALEAFESIYSKLLDRIEELRPKSEIVLESKRHPNKRYFLRKHVAVNNLFGTDIMPDAIETAKLRMFLALVSCLESRPQLEPLPDLDFNLKVGNLVVGFKDSSDVARVADGKLLLYNDFEEFGARMTQLKEVQDRFIEVSGRDDLGARKIKVELENSLSSLRDSANAFYADCADKPEDGLSAWVNQNHPFHWAIEFPKVFSNGGFDVIIGNPPYISRSKYPGDLSELRGYHTNGFTDFYELCFERSLQLLSNTGRISFIVMLSISFSADFKEIREIISEREGLEFWSTFAHRPDGLFTGPGVKNTIVSLGPGYPVQYSTQHNVFTKSSRNWLFENLDFHPISRKGGEIPVRGGLANDCLSEIMDFLQPLSTDGDVISVSPTALYWFPVLPFIPPRLEASSEVFELESKRAKLVKLGSNEDKVVTVAALAGKISFCLWHATADNFDVAPKDARYIRSFLVAVGDDAELHQSANSLLENIESYLIQTLYSGKLLINARWADARRETDPVDRRVLELSGLIEYWRPLNIWYRRAIPRDLETSGNSMSLTPKTRQVLRELKII
jgi:type I restriction-modification system DNA methylase subunit